MEDVRVQALCAETAKLAKEHQDKQNELAELRSLTVRDEIKLKLAKAYESTLISGTVKTVEIELLQRIEGEGKLPIEWNAEKAKRVKGIEKTGGERQGISGIDPRTRR